MPLSARLLGPLGFPEGQLTSESRLLAQENPRAFLAPAFFWLFLSALIAFLFIHAPTLPGLPTLPKSFTVGFFILMALLPVLNLFVLGWFIQRALSRQRRPVIAEPSVYTLRPGVWASLTSWHFLVALSTVLHILTAALAGAAWADPIGILLSLATAVLGIQSVANFYEQDTFPLLLSVAWPLILLLILITIVIIFLSAIL
ncbi:MAG: hypothetical protein ACYDEV_10655 [Acidiferrobacter sp.]